MQVKKEIKENAEFFLNLVNKDITMYTNKIVKH